MGLFGVVDAGGMNSEAMDCFDDGFELAVNFRLKIELVDGCGDGEAMVVLSGGDEWSERAAEARFGLW
ncbi:hypothetical protein M0R45_002418 [Rubus argutus]|uniref:Uncharacterized protein n=1 Tax=Rubus argutus TaxID=59490 RepID=A0AAW1VS43_RUBAR